MSNVPCSNWIRSEDWLGIVSADILPGIRLKRVDVLLSIWLGAGAQVEKDLVGWIHASRTQRKPMLVVELSGVFAVRAATRYRLQ
jgi:hypothetical protein